MIQHTKNNKQLKVLAVFSGNSQKAGTNSIISPFIAEQLESIEKLGVTIETFPIRKKGLKGYVSSLKQLKKVIRKTQPDLIHAHYGLSGLFANLQRKVPVITSFHGSDIYDFRIRPFSRICHFLSKESIFVSHKLKQKFSVKSGEVIPCGVDLDVFRPMTKVHKSNLVVFNGDRSNAVKNFALADAAINLYNERKHTPPLTLIELKKLSRKEVVKLLNQAQLMLITSLYEGSSQVLKEAMACNCPVVATDVGSVSDLISNESNAGIITSYQVEEIARAIHIVTQGKYDKGREELIEAGISLEQVANSILKLYHKIIN